MDLVRDIWQIEDAQEGHLEMNPQDITQLARDTDTSLLLPGILFARSGHHPKSKGKEQDRSRIGAGSSHPSFLSFSLHGLDPLYHSCLVIAEPQTGSKVACVFSPPILRHLQASGTHRPCSPPASADFRPQGCGLRAGLHVLRVRLKL